MSSRAEVVAELLDEMERTAKLLLAAIQVTKQQQAKDMAEKAK